MGTGKTSAAIKLMNESTNRKFIFVSPLLSEITRIKESCPNRKFYEPFTNKEKRKNKSDNLIELLEKGCNIATTHALFSRCTSKVMELVRQNGYTLILDEVMDVVEALEIKKSDAQLLFDAGIITVDEHSSVSWHNDAYLKTDGEFADIAQSIASGYVILDDEELMIWKFPFSVFEAFSDVYILTYLFDAQLQKYYFDMCGGQYEFIGARKCGKNQFEFCTVEEMDSNKLDIASKVHIMDDAKINDIGEKHNALSRSWFERESKHGDAPKRLKTTMESIVRNRWSGVLSENIMWSTHKKMRNIVKGKGYSSMFVPFNCRGTNDYSNKTHLLYAINIYVPSGLRMFFESHEVYVDQEKYALSIMIQWIWRSAIRNGHDVWLYLPSRRMRTLLQDWIKKVSI